MLINDDYMRHEVLHVDKNYEISRNYMKIISY